MLFTTEMRKTFVTINCLLCCSSPKENKTFAAKTFENVVHSFENMFSKFFENPLRICLEGEKTHLIIIQNQT